MRRLAGARILIVGMNGLGVEVGARPRGLVQPGGAACGGGRRPGLAGPRRPADCLTAPRACTRSCSARAPRAAAQRLLDRTAT